MDKHLLNKKDLEDALKHLRLEYEINFTNESHGYIDAHSQSIWDTCMEYFNKKSHQITFYQAALFQNKQLSLKDLSKINMNEIYPKVIKDVYKSIDKLIEIKDGSFNLINKTDYTMLLRWIENLEIECYSDTDKNSSEKIMAIYPNKEGKEILGYWQRHRFGKNFN